LDVTVNRNYFGRQVDSFEAWLETPNLKMPGLGASDKSDSGPCRAVFIRAPAITEVGPQVRVLAQLPGDSPCIVAVQQGMVMATAFHPELTDDLRWHAHFLQMAGAQQTQPE
jgi:pyridoxal 5'-phosphate synthase pdxT subunit